MPTNQPTIKALLGLTKLIDELNTKTTQNTIDEIRAWNHLLKKHLGQQKKQDGKWETHRYVYDKNTKRIKRLNESGEVTADY